MLELGVFHFGANPTDQQRGLWLGLPLPCAVARVLRELLIKVLQSGNYGETRGHSFWFCAPTLTLHVPRLIGCGCFPKS